jgi:hypothetical protein
MKLILTLIVTFISMTSITKASGFSDLDLCKSNDTILTSKFFNDCPGAKEIGTQIHQSNLSVDDFFHLLVKATKDVCILDDIDDLHANLHKLLLVEKKFKYYTTSGNSVVIIVEDGIYMYEKLEKSWRLKVILFD